MRQPDIEIYLRDAELPAISAWLEGCLGARPEWQAKGAMFRSQVAGIPLLWLPRAVGKWHCLLLESDATPWADDLSCAREAFAALNVEVRCMPGSWQEADGEENADLWLSVGPEGEREIQWRT